jgi:hypothetical protein
MALKISMLGLVKPSGFVGGQLTFGTQILFPLKFWINTLCYDKSSSFYLLCSSLFVNNPTLWRNVFRATDSVVKYTYTKNKQDTLHLACLQ